MHLHNSCNSKICVGVKFDSLLFRMTKRGYAAGEESDPGMGYPVGKKNSEIVVYCTHVFVTSVTLIRTTVEW